MRERERERERERGGRGRLWREGEEYTAYMTNPRRACAVRVPVRVCVCVSVCLLPELIC